MFTWCYCSIGVHIQKAGVAQSVEQRTRNAKVVGSIPISGTTRPARASASSDRNSYVPAHDYVKSPELNHFPHPLQSRIKLRLNRLHQAVKVIA